MTDQINVERLKRTAKTAADTYVLGWELRVAPDVVLALVEAVEAARMYRIRHAVSGPNAGQRITRDALDAALARFSFGEQP